MLREKTRCDINDTISSDASIPQLSGDTFFLYTLTSPNILAPHVMEELFSGDQLLYSRDFYV